jgi:hypothetical protein
MALSLSSSTSVVAFPVARIDPLSGDTGIVKLKALWTRFRRSLIREKWRDRGIDLFFAICWSWPAYEAYKNGAAYSKPFIALATVSWFATIPRFRATWLGIAARLGLIATGLALVFRVGLDKGASESGTSVLLIIGLCFFVFHNGRSAYEEVCWRFPNLRKVEVDGTSFLLLPDGISFLWFINEGARAAVTLPPPASAEVYRAISARDIRFIKVLCARCGTVLLQGPGGVQICSTCPEAEILFVWPNFVNNPASIPAKPSGQQPRSQLQREAN